VSETPASTTESRESSDEPVVEARLPATRQAVIVVLVLTALAILVIVQFAFSTANDRQSIDGTTATSSQYVGG
jgi:hypothetical protein